MRYFLMLPDGTVCENVKDCVVLALRDDSDSVAEYDQSGKMPILDFEDGFVQRIDHIPNTTKFRLGDQWKIGE